MIFDDIVHLSDSLGYVLALTLVLNKTCHFKFHFKQKKKVFKVSDLEAFTELNKNSLGQSAVDNCIGTDGFCLKNMSLVCLHLEILCLASSKSFSQHLTGIREGSKCLQHRHCRELDFLLCHMSQTFVLVWEWSGQQPGMLGRRRCSQWIGMVKHSAMFYKLLLDI